MLRYRMMTRWKQVKLDDVMRRITAAVVQKGNITAARQKEAEGAGEFWCCAGQQIAPFPSPVTGVDFIDTVNVSSRKASCRSPGNPRRSG